MLKAPGPPPATTTLNNSVFKFVGPEQFGVENEKDIDVVGSVALPLSIVIHDDPPSQET